MEEPNKILQGLGIPHSAISSIIFGMMLLSFPIGAFVVFNTNIGDEINSEYPLQNLDLFVGGLSFQIPAEFELGDAFIVLWSLYAVLFTIAMIGPKKGFIQALTQTLAFGKLTSGSNYMLSITKWFSILILVSGLINLVQEGFGIVTVSPDAENDLIQFYMITIAPLTEEIGFRVLLIGLPLFAIYSHKSSVKLFLKSLWRPSYYLHIPDDKRALTLIVVVGAFFGLAHIISGDAWSNGKFAQAAASGMILGWVYYRFGLISAILIHWATNYFIYSYANFISQINLISVQDSFSHSLFQTMELIFIISGILSIVILLIEKKYSREKHIKI